MNIFTSETVTGQSEAGENCRLCERIRKGEAAGRSNERYRNWLLRQKTEPVDCDENVITIGDDITFLSLYGYRTVTVTDITYDDGKGFIFHFEPLQIGPEPAFKPSAKWALNYCMQSCRKAS